MTSMSGGNKIQAALLKIRESLEMKMNVGILSGATNEETGELIAPYAAANEYGAVINVPAQTRDLEFKQNKAVEVGNKFVKKGKGNFTQTVVIPAHTINVPSRPFMRNAVAEKGNEWVKLLGGQLKGAAQDPQKIESAFNKTGMQAVSDIRDTIERGVPPPNAPSTVAKKKARGNADPYHTLVFTGAMQRALDYEIIKGDK